MKLLLGVAALFLCTSVAAVAAQSGIAYDEVSELYTARPLPLPTDFAKVYGDANNSAHAQNRRVFHIAFLGNLRRTEPGDGMVVTIDRPDLGKYLVLNPAKKTYWTEPFVSRETYAVGTLPASPSPSAPRVTAFVQGVHDSWPLQTIDGRTVAGMTSRIIIGVPGGGCRLAETLGFITVFTTNALPEQEFNGDIYAAPLNFAPAILSRLSGCNVQSPSDLLKQFPMYPNFVLYRAISVNSAPADLQFTEMGSVVPTFLVMRGNLRVLGDADKALFDVPQGYTLVPRPAATP